MVNNSSLTLFGRSRVATPHDKEWTRPLHVLLYVQCLLAYYRRVQSLSRRYATSAPHRRTHNDGVYRANTASRDKYTPNSNLADICSKKIKQCVLSPSATKVICEELRSHPHANNGLA